MKRRNDTWLVALTAVSAVLILVALYLALVGAPKAVMQSEIGPICPAHHLLSHCDGLGRLSRLFRDLCGRRRLPAHPGAPLGHRRPVVGRDRHGVHVGRAGQRLDLGQAGLGCVVGVGRAADDLAHPVPGLRRLPDAAQHGGRSHPPGAFCRRVWHRRLYLGADQLYRHPAVAVAAPA